MMASAFDGLHPDNAALIRARFLAGQKMVDIRKEFSLQAKTVRELRDEVFIPLLTDPQAVKDLANGPMLNASAMVKLPYARSTLTRLRQKANADALTDADKAEIRSLEQQERPLTYSAIARRYDVHANTIRAICKAA